VGIPEAVNTAETAEQRKLRKLEQLLLVGELYEQLDQAIPEAVFSGAAWKQLTWRNCDFLNSSYSVGLCGGWQSRRNTEAVNSVGIPEAVNTPQQAVGNSGNCRKQRKRQETTERL
jgi:hypothetical protein